MITFTRSIEFPRSARQVYDWHASKGALPKLIPPWQKVTVVRHDGIAEGSLAILRLHLGPLPIIWQARHTDVVPGQQFRDIQLAGPFKSWSHLHRLQPIGPATCVLTDEITCEVPGGRWANALARPFLLRTLRQLFAYRHAVTRAVLTD